MMNTYNYSQFYERSHNEQAVESELFKIGAELDIGPGGPWIAGGAVRRTLIGQPLESDVDVFFASAEQRDGLIKDLIDQGATKVSENDFCVTLSADVAGSRRLIQAIKPTYASLAQALDTFDFTLCQTGYDGESLVVSEYTLWDIGRMKLVPAKITYGVASIRRLIKYTKQGFKICNGGIGNILHQIVGNPQTIDAKTEYID